MENFNNDKEFVKSYNYDHYSNIIAENVDDLIYDKFYYNEQISKSFKKNNKPSKTSYIFKSQNKIYPEKILSFKNNYINKKKNNKAIKRVFFTLDKLFVSKDEDIIRYKNFINNNRRVISYLKNRKLNNFKNSIINDKNKENKNTNKSCSDINPFNKIQKNKNNRSNISYNIENSKEQSNSKDNKLYLLNIKKQNSNNYRINDLNLYNKSQKNESDISNNLTIRTSFSKSNKNNYKYRNFHSMKESFLIKEKTKFNYSNISDIINDNHKYEKIFNFSKKKLKKKKSLKEEDKNSFKDVDFNYLSFSYPKKENDIKQKHYNNHRYQKHFRNERECPLCKSITIKTKINEQLMGILNENDKDKKLNKNNIRKIIFKNNSNCYISNNKNINKPSSSKIQLYKKDLCFFNATKGISNSKSDIDLANPKTDKNSYIYKKMNNDFPVMVYYFK